MWEEAQKTAREDPEQEAKSVASNTQELAKDTWPCPLRGKKFRAEFVRTHIVNTHAEKTEQGGEEEGTFVTAFSLVPSAQLCLRPRQLGPLVLPRFPRPQAWPWGPPAHRLPRA